MGETKGSTENIVKISWLKKKKESCRAFLFSQASKNGSLRGFFIIIFLFERQNQSILMDSLGNDNTILLNYRERDCEIRLAG